VVFILILFLVIYLPTRWMWYWPWLIATSIVTFVFYGFDKMQAKNNGARVPEVNLHVLSLIGGVLGGWLGRRIFRHKTLHTAFLAVLIIASIVHGVIIILILV
jgi:uncharacterized membrane protein YsdA (DUF1294 family)